MPELVGEEQITALEAENAHLTAALLELHGPPPGPLCRCVNCNDFKPCPGQALAGDDSALKARLDAARMEGFKDGQEVRDSLRAQLADDSPGTPLGIIKALFEFAEAECGHNPASARHALTTVMETIATLRAQLAEAERERDEQRRRYKDELSALHDTRRDRERLLDLATAQVERLRKLAGDVNCPCCGHKLYAHAPDGCQERRSKVMVQGDRCGCKGKTVSEDITAEIALLAETPEQSLAAVREQARREALTEAAPIVRASILQWVVKAGHDPRSAIGDWALNTADIISEEIRDLATQPAKEPE